MTNTTHAAAANMVTSNKVTARENAEGRYEVSVKQTGEILSVFDSLYLAKQMVCTINRNVR